MYTIQTSIEIAAPIATLHPAITTLEGFRAWLAEDTQVHAPGRYTFSFGPRAVTFAVDRADDRSIVMTCVREQDNPDWLGTELSITLTPIAGGTTRVDLVHAGYASKNECYARSSVISPTARYVPMSNATPEPLEFAGQETRVARPRNEGRPRRFAAFDLLPPI